MTDVNYLQTFALPSAYDQQMLEAKRRQQYADMLQQQASQSIIPQQGRIASKINPLAGVAQMLAAGLGGYERRQAENAQLAANQADVQNAMSFMDKLQAGKRPDFTPDQALAASLSSEPTPTPQNVPFSPQERQQMLIRQSMTGGPRSQAIAQMLMAQKQPTAMDFVNKIDADKVTPESLAAFTTTAMAGAPDFSKLKLKPEKAVEVPSAIKEYEYAVGQGYKGSYQQFVIDQKRAGATNVTTTYGAPVAGEDAQGNRIFFQPSKEGGKPAIIPGVAPEKKQPTAEQAGAAGFAGRLEAADKIISQSQYVPTPMQELKGNVPFVGNYLMTPAQQEIAQAKRNFVTAQLRKESGASISPTEFSTAEKMYFPQPGDTAETIAQKAATRKQAIAAMRGMSGNAVSMTSDVPPAGAVRRVR